MSDSVSSTSSSVSADVSKAILVQRSSVPAGLEYSNYKPYLRLDFFYSCAYCTMTEAEAQAVRFVIDHYEPQWKYPELRDVYENLMYSCDECNIRKGTLIPSEKARENGIRFFRPDRDDYADHFERNGTKLLHKSEIGDFTIDAIDLNREALRRLREIRSRLTYSEEFVTEGVRALRRFKIDQLPADVKAKAAAAIKRVVFIAGNLGDEVDDMLRRFASSSLSDVPNEDPRKEELRKAKLKKLQALYAGVWRAPTGKKKRKRT